MRIDLTSAAVAWKMAYVKDSELNGRAISSVQKLRELGLPLLDATVPGNFEIDLQRNGIIGDPFYGANVLETHKLEDCHAIYFAEFLADGPADADCFLVFEGLDTIADIYIDGALIASTDNMLIGHRIPLAFAPGTCHELLVHIKPACIVARQHEYTAQNHSADYNMESLHIRKAPHMYGWDIMPRIVSAGIWRPVFLEYLPKERIESFYLQTLGHCGEGGTAALLASFQTRISGGDCGDYALQITGRCGECTFSHRKRLNFCAGNIRFEASGIRLWWPRGRGEPNLYDVTVSLIKNGEVLDTFQTKFGIRTVRLDRTSVTDEMGSGQFCFVVNGERVFANGTNWVPVDALHSRDRQRIPPILDMVGDIGCNMLRCWGGNVYEDDLFYDTCDTMGIMVWQDFSMACAVYPQTQEFQQKLETEARAVIHRLRQHPCIVLWAGDNECDLAYSWGGRPTDPNSNVLTRSVLPQAIRENDPDRPYLPSSPYVDGDAFRKGEKYLPEYHLWGPRDYFKSSFYTTSLCHFASEIGYHGCPNPESIAKFISPGKLWPYAGNMEWQIHGTSPKPGPECPYHFRVELMARQIGELFGAIPDNLQEFALASQISQAEAFKFFIELFRSSKWRRTGIIWWNLMDGWPQFSDAVVDYYFGKKLAYHYIKRSQQPLCIVVKEPGDWKSPVLACNDTRTALEVSYAVRDADDGTMLLQGRAKAAPDAVTELGSIPFSHSMQRFYLIEWESELGHGQNHYLAGFPAFDLAKYRQWMAAAGYSWPCPDA